MRLFSIVFAVFGLASFLGCSDGSMEPPAQAEVSGNVTLDGKPMEGGEVRFNIPGQPVVSLPVQNGSFAGKVFVGENRVDVVWEKEGAPHPMDPTQRLMENVVSSKFSGPGSPFQQAITSEGASNLTFAVTSGR